MEQKEYLIIYHKEDNDGVVSAAIFYDYLIHKLHINIEDICLLGADYNILKSFQNDNKPSDIHKDFKHIIMTDISFNDVSYMKKLCNEFVHNFIWCDHHAPIIKSSFEMRFDDVPGVRDTGRSAILCVWKFLYDQFDEAYNDKKVPELLRILSAWDSWSYIKEGYTNEYVRNVNKGFTQIYDLSITKIKSLIRELVSIYVDSINLSKYFFEAQLIDQLYNTGKMLNDYDDQLMKQIIENNGDCSWHLDDGSRCCAIFHQGATSSLHFKSIKNNDPTIKCGIVFKHQSNSNWVVSLYNIYDTDDFDCGKYCKDKYNGGGHTGAAGCTLLESQFIKILKNKTF